MCVSPVRATLQDERGGGCVSAAGGADAGAGSLCKVDKPPSEPPDAGCRMDMEAAAGFLLMLVLLLSSSSRLLSLLTPSHRLRDAPQ